MANRLLSYKPNMAKFYKLKKPVLPVVSEETELLDLISPHSFKFFTILDMDYKWPEIDPELLDSDKNFRSARDFVKTVKVTNDVAERGVKLHRTIVKFCRGMTK